MTSWWFQKFLTFTRKLGKMIQFDCIIFLKTGWFNHQLDDVIYFVPSNHHIPKAVAFPVAYLEVSKRLVDYNHNISHL